MPSLQEDLLDSSIIQIWGDLEYPNLLPAVQALLLTDLKKPSAVTISICSAGGDFNLAVGLFDLIRLVSNAGIRVYTFCFGEVSSGGIILLAAGDDRYATPNTSFCIHPVFDEAAQENDYPETHRYLSLIEARTGLSTMRSLAEIQSTIGKEWNFGSKTALEIGLITKIVGEPK